MKKLISRKDKILQAIQEAEKQTSGEIKVHIQRRVKGDIFDAAKEKFNELGMSATEQKNGVLIFIAVKDRKFTIIGDEGINEKVPDDFWQESVDEMIPFFANNCFIEGIRKGVSRIGIQLRELFPYQSDDKNELSDEVSIDEDL